MILFLIFYFFLSLACCLYLIIAQSRLRKGPFCIFWNFWRLAQLDGFWFVKKGWVLVRGTPKTPFLFWSEETGLTAPTRASGPIPPRVTPAHPERLHSTQAAGQTTQGTTHTPGRWTRRAGQIVPAAGYWRAWSVQCQYVAHATFLCACTFNLEYTIDLYV